MTLTGTFVMFHARLHKVNIKRTSGDEIIP